MAGIGGIQTLLLRSVKWMAAHGHSCVLLTARERPGADERNPLLDQVSEHATVIRADHRYIAAGWTLRRLRLPPVDVIVACNLTSLLLAAVVQEMHAPLARLMASAYHSHEYCWKSERTRFDQRLVRALIEQIPVQNLLFSNDSFARLTGECAGRDLRQSPVAPLAIDTARYERVIRHSDGRSIVSVARLADYYTHHWHMIDAVATLRDRGVVLEYHVYGDGVEADALRRYVNDRAASDLVVFHGALAYEQFGETLSTAYAFIGGGTALAEAAACGVPSLVTIGAVPTGHCYGWLHETPGNGLGAPEPDSLQFSIVDQLEALTKITIAEYTAMENASRVRARDFSMDVIMPTFVRALENSRPFRFPIGVLAQLHGGLDRVLWRLRVLAGSEDPYASRYVQALRAR